LVVVPTDSIHGFVYEKQKSPLRKDYLPYLLLSKKNYLYVQQIFQERLVIAKKEFILRNTIQFKFENA